MRRHFQVHLHLTNLCCQWKAAPDERDVSPPESATKVGGKCVIEPLKSGEPCQLLEKVEPGLQPAWRASHANWKGHKGQVTLVHISQNSFVSAGAWSVGGVRPATN